MAREFDCRDFSIDRTTQDRKTKLAKCAEDCSNDLAGNHRIRISAFDSLTGNASTVISESSPGEKAKYWERALQHLNHIGATLGLEPGRPGDFVADQDYQTTSSGAVTVHLHQHYKNIPIFEAAMAVRFSADGAIRDTIGQTISIPEDLSVEPAISAEQAVMTAAKFLAEPEAEEPGEDHLGFSHKPTPIAVKDFTHKVKGSEPDDPCKPTMIQVEPFEEDVKTQLVWFPTGDDVRLAWTGDYVLPGGIEMYRTIVDASSGEMLFCGPLGHSLVQGNVFRVDGGSSRESTTFPVPLEEYGLPIPESPADRPAAEWVTEDDTAGNNVRARLVDDAVPLQGDGLDGNVLFEPADADGDDQRVLQIFYFCNVMHDFFYLLGFRESDGNFQLSNSSGDGLGFDRVDARIHDRGIRGTATMRTRPDGRSPSMNAGTVTNGRHSALDSSVIYHEYAHGVTNRLIGGRLNTSALSQPQSRGMGEGFSDYIACTINDAVVVGSWLVNRARGIRGFPYDSDYPDNFSQIGTGRFFLNSDNQVQVHSIGELICAPLVEINRRIGKNLAVQLVVDAWKMMQANPSFLNVRDALLQALDDQRDANMIDDDRHDTARSDMWRVFAQFGMGPNASTFGASLSGIVADFETPADVTTLT